jgi:drug/metabolite transporter (DMT)-like permease
MRFPSIGLIELVILAGVAALAVLSVAAVVVIVLRRRRGNDARPWKWIAIVGSILVVLPLLVVILAILLIMPARVERSTVPASQAVIVAVEPAAAPKVTLTASDGTLTGTPPRDTPPSDPAPVGSAKPEFPSIVPDTWLEALVIPAIVAGLMVLLGAAIVALVLTRWSGDGEHDRLPQSRAVLLALAFWIALTLVLILDLGLGLAVSVYATFVAAYAAFWVLVGVLLLVRRPMREKVLILALFVVVLLSVRFIDWNSRKPFLRDFYRINEGMTESQVDQIMDGYMKGYFGGPPPSLREYEPQLDEQGKIITGWVTYRHTDEGWGNSDWGEVTFENGRVVETRFLHD